MLILTLLNDGKVINLDNPIEVRARNFDGDIAVLKSMVSGNAITISPAAELPSGIYSYEVWTGDDDNRQIYPSKGYNKFQVSKSLLTGDTIKVLDNDGLNAKIKQAVGDAQFGETDLSKFALKVDIPSLDGYADFSRVIFRSL